MDLEAKLRAKSARVGVVGLGYVGLPLAVEFAHAGFHVNGFEIDPEKVARLQRGESYVGDVPSGRLAPIVESGSLTPTTDTALIAECDTVNICVPTPLGKSRDPDVSYIVEALDAIVPHLHRGMLIILESTTYPGTTEELILPTLEETGLRAGSDFHLAFSPERVDPGNPRYHTKNIPKIVGGVTPECTRIAGIFYSCVIDRIVPVPSPKVAEMAKLLENTFRSVNIALVNELALLCDRMSINVWEVIDAAATKPFGFMPFYPGPGLGGHCIPVDPYYLSWKARAAGFPARFIELAGEINASMPLHVVRRVSWALNSVRESLNGSSILVLGVSYKADVDDTRESPALDIIELLLEHGADVLYHDPHVPDIYIGDSILRSVPLDVATLNEASCVVLVTPHRAFDYGTVLKHSRLIVDTRNAWKGIESPKVFRL